MPDVLQLDDIQGLVVRGYGRLPHACYLPMTVRDAGAARGLLAGWAEHVTPARTAPADEALNLALTAAGLRAVTGWAALPRGFSYPFADGMASPYRSRFLGDVGQEDPRHWRWGGPETGEVHLLVLVYARTAEALRARVDGIVAQAAGGGLAVLQRLESEELSRREPFGFADSISQPAVAGLPGAGEAADPIRAGEFVLGYHNEYGQFTDRPVVPAADDPKGLLARDDHGRADLGRNGTYLVVRQLEQDVTGFWRTIEDRSRRPDGTVDAGLREHLAAKVVGRWTSGAPLVLAPERDDPPAAHRNDFGYHATDPLGLACPVGAHIRRVNPRDSLDPAPGTDRSLEINKRHRLLRRGRAYRVGGPAGEERGLHFLCLNANLARQFEFVQHTWVDNPVFNGLHGETDPLIGRRATGDDFTEPARPVRRRHHGLPRFVTVRGGAYFFLPGLSALQYLTSTTGEKDSHDSP